MSEDSLPEGGTARTKDYLVKAIELFTRGDYGGAENSCTLAIQADPTMADAHYLRATCRHLRYDLRAALDDVSHALALNPNDARYVRGYGTSSERLGDYETAMECYKRSIALDPASHFGYLSLANLLASCPVERFRDGKLAMENARSAFALAPSENWKCFGSLAASHAEIGQFPKAIEFAQRALDLAPEGEKRERVSRLELYRSGRPYRSKEVS